MKKHGIYVKLWSHHLHTWWFKAWISIFFLFSHKICTSFHPVSKLSSCSFNDCCWRSDSSWIHLGPLAMSCLKSGSRLSISSLRSSCSFSIFSASNRDTGISSDATSFWVLFSLEKNGYERVFSFGSFILHCMSKQKDCTSEIQKGDQYKFLGNCPPTPPLSQHFALRVDFHCRVIFPCERT